MQLNELDKKHFSAAWFKEMQTVIENSYRLQAEILPPSVTPVSITGFRNDWRSQPSWEKQNPNKGKIAVSPNVHPTRISRTIGKGIYLKLVNANYLRRGHSADFEEFFEYLFLNDTGNSPSPLKNNYFYDCSRGKKHIFIQKLHNKVFKK